MKKKIIFSIAFLMLLLFFITKWSEIKYYFKFDNAKVVLLNRNIDFGKISIRDSVSIQYKIWNRGKNELKVNQVVPSCECTIVDLEDKVIAPNDTLIVKILFKPEKVGKVKKEILLDANTAPPFHILTFEGEVVK